MLKNIDMSPVILQTYQSSWYIWVGFFILGFLLFKYAENISETRREINKRESSGAGLMAISTVVHFGVLYALL